MIQLLQKGEGVGPICPQGEREDLILRRIAAGEANQSAVHDLDGNSLMVGRQSGRLRRIDGFETKAAQSVRTEIDERRQAAEGSRICSRRTGTGDFARK